MRMLSLAVFAAVALVVGAYEEDEMTLLIGVAVGAGRARVRCRDGSSRPSSPSSPICSPPRRSCSASLDLVALLGYWPHAYEEYELPRYLPLATALFVVVIFAVSHLSPRAQDDDDRRPVLRGA